MLIPRIARCELCDNQRPVRSVVIAGGAFEICAQCEQGVASAEEKKKR